ncbi:hypothetical protein FJZ17_01345 [Candidatus Pacearchaeota archaeon]|nr:hypothetical protein [Candidatus Pacearchaeota archaeon]
MESEERIIEQRKKKIIGYFKENNKLWIYVVLLLLVILGIYIRYQPLTDHNGNPGLWDATQNDYTLGPDLDPFLFLRYAREIIETGELSQIDNMRNVPLGFDTTTELQMVSYMIVLTYRVLNIFGTYSINYAGAFMPVWMFALTIIAFFFFVREIFIRKNEKETELKANLISLVSTLFMIIIPGFLSRTVAGIPEKESVAFFFMFLSFFLFLKAWKTEKLLPSSIIAILAGISTALMGLTWGGVTYIYIAISLATLAAFIINKVNKKETFVYGLWLVSSLLVLLSLTNRFSLKGFILGLDTGLATACLGILIFHLILWKTNLNKIIRLDKINLPDNIKTIILFLVVAIIIGLIISPGSIFELFQRVNDRLIKPVTGRWNTTVAENKQPYFTEWFSSFGKTLFWAFIIGSIVLFSNIFKKLKRKDNIILTLSYVIFLFGLIFSRYASHPSILDGEGFFSKFMYYGSALIFLATIIYYYNNYHKQKDPAFDNTEYEYLLLFSLFILTLFTARSAVRLIMVLVPLAPIFLSYFLVDSGFKIKSNNKNKVIYIAIFFILLFITIFSAVDYYKTVKNTSYGYIPYYYTNQWQNAMAWVRENTLENSVFAHWWDYGYWVQSMGNRATVTDGGNVIVWWNYLTGRYVLTGDNQNQALEFLWNHNVDYLLIDSSDIGKYGAFSQIGSNENYDRLSQGPLTFVSYPSNMIETKTGVQRMYTINAGVYSLDEDISYTLNNTKYDLFQENSGIGGILLEYGEQQGQAVFKQPHALFINNNKRVDLPIRYLQAGNELYDFKTGINAAVKVIQKVGVSNNQLSVDNLGSIIYLSPRVLRGLLGQVYILNNSLGNFPNFKIAHIEKDIITRSFSQNYQGLEEFVYYENYGGLQGPIKIWKIEYTGQEKENLEFVQKTVPEYITWKF